MKLSIVVIDDMKNPRTQRRARLFCRRIFQGLIQKREFSFLKRKREIAFAVAIVKRQRSLALNRKFRKKSKPANVLSFPVYKTLAELRADPSPDVQLGDIVVCPAVIHKEARRIGSEFYAQFFWMMLHGILHLLGCDHERGAREHARMEALEHQVLRRFHS
ncbi:MAG: putative rRNA maturation factor [Parcubacteria group bacterium GW2011_GWA1_51_12]|nr:MAG: putative rRNA maturation factor [Parcubacteria group bacterium GW2011_GWA1_51_12]